VSLVESFIVRVFPIRRSKVTGASRGLRKIQSLEPLSSQLVRKTRAELLRQKSSSQPHHWTAIDLLFLKGKMRLAIRESSIGISAWRRSGISLALSRGHSTGRSQMLARSLFLHIGHHKTGTTTLQLHVFPQFESPLKSLAYIPKRTSAADGIRMAFRASPAIWRQHGDQIFTRVIAELDERGTSGSALISSEGMSAPKVFAAVGRLSNRVRRDPFLLAAHISECRMAATRAGFADVRVIMGIRRQDQCLASYYAQHGALADEPGQADFERQTLEIIDPEKRYFIDGIWFDFQMTRELIIDVVGVDGMLILPLEQLRVDRVGYLSALGCFLGETIVADEDEAARYENVRSVAPDTWRCTLGSHGLGRLFARAGLAAGREVKICLRPELKSKIMAAYEDSNRRLATDIGVDLAGYGYF
jgi:hypothetical protein